MTRGCASRRGFISASVALLGALSLPASLRASGISGGLWDVVVLGSGAAGLSAACAAADVGARRVLVLEKGPLAGGHTLYSSGSIAMVSKKRQAPLGIEDSVERFVEDALRVGGDNAQADILRRIAEESGSVIDWLEGLGVRFGPIFTAYSGIHRRCVSMPGNSAGRSYILALMNEARRLGVEIRFGCRAVKLEPVPGTGTDLWRIGLELDGRTSSCLTRSVVVATGGFTANVERRMRVHPKLTADIRTSANPYGTTWDGADGDALDLIRGIGGAERSGFGVQLLPFWGGRLLDYVGGDIFVTHEGERFVDESLPMNSIAEAILRLPERTFWVITDRQSFKGATLGVKFVNGIVKKSDTVEEMAEGMGLSAQVLKETLRRYNRAVESGWDGEFGKRIMLQKIDQPPFYWGAEAIYVHTTLDGVATDSRARVLTPLERPIPGIFAAGEVVGGVFGRDRLGGAGLANAFVMGRAAGGAAARFARSV